MCRNNSARARGDGFTLIELLVVVVIIAIVAATAVLAIGTTGRDRQLEQESRKMLALLDYSREQAELRTREFGLLCEETGYRFVTFDQRKQLWVIVETDEALHPRELPGGLSVQLTVESRPVVLRRPPDSKDYTPQVMLFSNGDVTPFELTLLREDSSRSVTIGISDKGALELRPLQERQS